MEGSKWQFANPGWHTATAYGSACWQLLIERWMSNKLSSNFLIRDSFLHHALSIRCWRMLSWTGLSLPWLPQAPLPQLFSIGGVMLGIQESHNCNAGKIEECLQSADTELCRDPRAQSILLPANWSRLTLQETPLFRKFIQTIPLSHLLPCSPTGLIILRTHAHKSACHYCHTK